MTASNVFVQGECAYLLTDGAVYDSEGVVAAIQCKVAAIPHLRMAVAFSGCVGRAVEACVGFFVRVRTQREAFGGLPDIAEQLYAAYQADVRREGIERTADFQMYVAMHSLDTGEPQAWILSTNRAGFGASYEPWSLRRVHEICAPRVDRQAVFGRVVDLTDPASFDPATDGLTLLEAQRNVVWPNGRHYIGGKADLTVVSRHGITKHTLREWPDVVGERINPNG